MPLLPSLPKYHSKDLTVLAICQLPGAVVLNYLLYGPAIFDSAWKFSALLLVTFLYISLMFICCGLVAVTLRARFPSDRDLLKRILISLGVFYLMSAAFISILLLGYDALSLFGYNYQEIHFYKVYSAAVIINTFLTFLNEAIYRFEKLKETVTHNEQLKKEYLRSRLLGLKSQMNPHFLFNSLNTLSSLIHEDDERAEEFLNHMSKLYRYLLRHRDERLVPLQTEISFIRSYYYLLKQRYCEGIDLSVEMNGGRTDAMIAPYTLQMIIEDAVERNTISRSSPLQVRISGESDRLVISNSLKCRMGPCIGSEGMDNVLAKYRLLDSREIEIRQSGDERIISIPLIDQKQEVWA